MNASSGLSAEEIAKQAWLHSTAPEWEAAAQKAQKLRPRHAPAPQTAVYTGSVRPSAPASEDAAKQAWLARTAESRAPSWGNRAPVATAPAAAPPAAAAPEAPA